MTGVLGSGANATVYLGNDPRTGGPVAIKVLDRAVVDDSDIPVRLRGEADAMRRIRDRHCVQVVDVVDEPPVFAIVTEFIAAATLRAVVAGAGRLTGPQALGVLRGVLLGLIAVHEAGLIHGDVKPANILVDRKGDSCLIDFGLARPFGSTRGSGLAGSPAYLSPEQVRGDEADVRSDVYACGAVLFELLTGRYPYAGGDVDETLRMHLDAPVPDPRAVDSGIGRDLAEVCIRALAKQPSGRYQTAQAFLDALEHAARQRYGTAWLTGATLGGLVGAVAPMTVQGLDGSRAPARKGRGGRLVAVSALAATVVATLIIASSHNEHPRPGAHSATPVRSAVPAQAATPSSTGGGASCTDSTVFAGLLTPPLPGDVVRPADSGTFDLAQFLAASSITPGRDRAMLNAAGFHCGIRRFAQNATRGDVIYIYQVRDAPAARVLQSGFAGELRAQPAARAFAVPSVGRASGVQFREAGGITSGPFYSNTVLFTCDSYLVQLGIGTSMPSDPVAVIEYARRERALFSNRC